MTVQNTPPVVSFLGNGAITSFVFNFRVDDIAWLSVDFLTDFDQFLLNGDQDANPGGSAEYIVPPPLAQELTITRMTALTQELDYQRYDPFDSESHENALDKLTMEIQDHNSVLVGHVTDIDIHFTDAPADGMVYARRNNSWIVALAGVTDHFLLTNIGTIPHVGIDAHILDPAIHFADAVADGNQYARRDNTWEIVGVISDHTLLTNIGVNTHAMIDAMISVLVANDSIYAAHVANGSIHFTEASIDHASIQNIGVNTHVQIDTHIADNNLHSVVDGATTTPSSPILTLSRSGGLPDLNIDLTNILEAEVALAREIDDDRPANNFIYIGEAIPGSGATSAAVWRIRRLEFLSAIEDDIEQFWADGDADFDNIWDDRAALSYVNT